jgi:hypothetical protein
VIAHSAGEGGNRVTPVSILQLHAAPWWAFAIVIAALSLHVGGGSLGILSGYTAVFALKGAPLHRVFGTVFVVSMLIMAVMGLALSVWIRQTSNIIGGGLAAYLVATAWITVKRQAGTVGHAEIVLFVVALAITGLLVDWAWLAAMSAKGTYQGFRAPFYLVFGFFAALFAMLDLKVILRRGVSGAPRILRHLWRMCFALFFAAASFFLGQQKVMPAFMHGSPLLYIPALAPLALMIYWLVRVRFPKQRRGQRPSASRTNLPLGQPT